jgi:hypothetical protein
MSLQTKLLGGAALCMALTISAGATAEARTATRGPASQKDLATAAEVTALRAEIQALEQRLAAQEQAQRQTQSQAQQAQTAAQAAADQARTLQAQAETEIKTIPAQVKTAVAAAKPKPGWEGSTSVSGRMYYDITNIEQKKDGAKTAPSGASFDIKRFYVGIDHKFNDTYSGNVTTDVAYVAADGLTQIYIKKAYLQAKYSDALTVRLGSADLPWVPFAEEVYGYRFIENTIADRDKFGTSADWGVHAMGKLGMFNYAVSVINGAGYKNPGRTSSVDIEGRVSTSFNGVTLGIGGHTGKLGKEIVGGVATPHTANRFDAIAAYGTKNFKVGVEYFTAENWNTVTAAAADKSDGTSLFANYNFTPEISIFGRYDWVKPSKTLASNRKEGYFNFGINYEPVKVVDFALVYKRDRLDNGALSTSNGTIGGTKKGAYDEIGLFGQYRW